MVWHLDLDLDISLVLDIPVFRILDVYLIFETPMFKIWAPFLDFDSCPLHLDLNLDMVTGY